MSFLQEKVLFKLCLIAVIRSLVDLLCHKLEDGSSNAF